MHTSHSTHVQQMQIIWTLHEFTRKPLSEHLSSIGKLHKQHVNIGLAHVYWERREDVCTMGQTQVVLRHLIKNFPTSSRVFEWVKEQTNKHSGACGQSKQCRASGWVRNVSKQANGQASDPVLLTRFLVVLEHSIEVSRKTIAYRFLVVLDHSVIEKE